LIHTCQLRYLILTIPSAFAFAANKEEDIIIDTLNRIDNFKLAATSTNTSTSSQENTVASVPKAKS